MRSPACFASAVLADITAGTLPFPGKANPIASVKQFIEFAVYIPEQEPQLGQADFSISVNSSKSIFPEA